MERLKSAAQGSEASAYSADYNVASLFMKVSFFFFLKKKKKKKKKN